MNQVQSNQKNCATQVMAITNPTGKIFQLSISALVVLLLSLLVISCSDRNKEVAERSTKIKKEESVKVSVGMIADQNYEIVPNEKVCMVNDKYMGINQIPIDVNGITYYGCCANCVEKLQNNLNGVRFGINPLKQTKVDKASAVIVQDKSIGSVFYFTSQEDAKAYIDQK